MSKFRYTQLMHVVLVCTFGISLLACGGEQDFTPTPVSTSPLPPTLTPTSQPLPDLVIINAVLYEQLTTPCDTTTLGHYYLRVEVANIGEAKAVPFLVGLDNTSGPRIDPLEPGETTFVTLSAINTGNEKTTVVIDQWNEVLEQNENNNTFVVQEELPPCNIVAPSSIAPDLTSIPEPEATQKSEPEQKLMELYPAGQPVKIWDHYMIDAQHGWAITDEAEQYQHVLRTSDGGQTWVDVTPPETITVDSDEYEEVTGFFLNAETAWVIYYSSLIGTIGSGNVWRTQDGGRSWQPSWGLPKLEQGGDYPFPWLEFVDAQHGWVEISYFLGAGTYRHELLATSDGGQTWELRASNWGFSVDEFIDPLHGWETGYSTPVDGLGIFLTDDGGHTWRRQGLPALSFDSCDRYEVGSPTLFSPRSGMLRIDCEFAGVVSHEGLYVTNDSGKNWQIYNLPGETVGGSLDILNSKVIYLLKEKTKENRSEGQRADLFRSRDGGRSWTKVTTLGWYGDLDFVDETIGWAVVRNENDDFCMLLHSIDRGHSWTNFTMPGPYCELEFVDEKVAWVVVRDENNDFLMLMHTTDGGQTWEQLAPQTVSEGETPRWGGTLPPRIELPKSRTILEPGNAQELKTLAEVPLKRVTDIDFEEWGQVAIAQQNGQVTLWDTTGVEYPMVLHRHQDWAYDVKLYGILAASVSKDGTIFVRLRDSQISQDGRAGEITSVAYWPDLEDVNSSIFIATASEKDWAVKIWDEKAEALEEQQTLKGHTDWVWDVTFSPDGSTLASASSDATVRLWDPNSGATLHVLHGHTSTVWRVEFSPDGKTLASASWDGTVKLWDVSTGEELVTLRGHEGPVYGVAFSSDGKLLASGAADGTVMVWDVVQAKLLAVLRGHTGPIRSIAFDPEGDILASASDDGTVKFWGVVP